MAIIQVVPIVEYNTTYYRFVIQGQEKVLNLSLMQTLQTVWRTLIDIGQIDKTSLFEIELTTGR